MRFHKIAVVLFSLGLILGPAVSWVAGLRASAIENRVLVSFPDEALRWDSLAQLKGFIADRLPLKSTAIRIDSWVDRNVFDEDPAFGGGASPRVLAGEDGYLFLADDLDAACAPHGTPADVARGLRIFATAVRDSGREIVLAVAPDKSSLHSEKLPSDHARIECHREYTERLWRRLRASVIPGYVDLLQPMRREVRERRRGLFLRKDSHWDPAGSLLASQTLVKEIDRSIWSPGDVITGGTYEYVGDLNGMLGITRPDVAVAFGVSREGVRQQAVITSLDGKAKTYKNQATDSRVIEGKTLFLHDSFGELALGQLTPYFRELTSFRLHEWDNQAVATLIEDADRVIYLSVERSLSWRATRDAGSREFIKIFRSVVTRR